MNDPHTTDGPDGCPQCCPAESCESCTAANGACEDHCHCDDADERLYTDDASGGCRVPADSLPDYIADALGDPGSYNQGEDGVTTLIRATGPDGDGWIDFAAHRQVAAALAALRNHRGGTQINWTHDAGSIVLDPPAGWDADTTDDAIREAVAAAAAESTAAGRRVDTGGIEAAVDYWTEARNSAQEQRELAESVISLLDIAELQTYADAPPEYDSGILADADSIMADLVACEAHLGDATTYGPIQKLLSADE